MGYGLLHMLANKIGVDPLQIAAEERSAARHADARSGADDRPELYAEGWLE
jgi:hypothetical protein